MELKGLSLTKTAWAFLLCMGTIGLFDLVWHALPSALSDIVIPERYSQIEPKTLRTIILITKLKYAAEILTIALTTLAAFAIVRPKDMRLSGYPLLCLVALALTIGREVVGISVGFTAEFIFQILISWACALLIWLLWARVFRPHS
jgi:hypothetical protein